MINWPMASFFLFFIWVVKSSKKPHRANIRSGVEDTRLKAKAKDTKKSKAKDRPSEGSHARGQGLRKQAQVFSKKKVFKNFFQAISKKMVIKNIFQAIHKTLTIQKMVLFSSRGQNNFRGLEASRPRTSKCVLEAKDVLEDFTSG